MTSDFKENILLLFYIIRFILDYLEDSEPKCIFDMELTHLRLENFIYNKNFIVYFIAFCEYNILSNLFGLFPIIK